MASTACGSAAIVCAAPASGSSSKQTHPGGAGANAEAFLCMRRNGANGWKDGRQWRVQAREGLQSEEAMVERAAAPCSGSSLHGSGAVKLGLVGALAAALMAGGSPVMAADTVNFNVYFGTAASASSYGGYGGNSSKRDTAEYTFEVPQGWKERLISKVEKGTNGTDSEFYNPKRKEEKVYLTFLSGFRKLAPRDAVLDNLALSDVTLQDIISFADEIKASDRQDDKGQIYYDYEIDSPVAHGLISVTCAKNKLYAHFVKAPVQDWARDEQLLRHIHESFQTI